MPKKKLRELAGTPAPRYFGKRGCKLLKTNEESAEKRAKRRQAIDGKGLEEKGKREHGQM